MKEELDQRSLAREYAQVMRCNCDLDTWEPEMDTGHSWVCRIHKATKEHARTGRRQRVSI